MSHTDLLAASKRRSAAVWVKQWRQSISKEMPMACESVWHKGRWPIHRHVTIEAHIRRSVPGMTSRAEAAEQQKITQIFAPDLNIHVGSLLLIERAAPCRQR